MTALFIGCIWLHSLLRTWGGIVYREHVAVMFIGVRHHYLYGAFDCTAHREREKVH